jgi:hypothetical protein
MSYCRLSSDNFRCDLYCYQSSAGFETNVASFRHRRWLRLFYFLTDRRVPISDDRTIRLQRWSLWGLPHWFTHKRIRLPYAGKFFTDATEQEMFVRILDLARTGYRIPASLREEIDGKECDK